MTRGLRIALGNQILSCLSLFVYTWCPVRFGLGRPNSLHIAMIAVVLAVLFGLGWGLAIHHPKRGQHLMVILQSLYLLAVLFIPSVNIMMFGMGWWIAGQMGMLMILIGGLIWQVRVSW